MKGKTRWIVAGVLALSLLAIGVGGTIAFAQGPTPTPQTGKTTWFDLYRQALAQKLGTTVEKLQQAETDARKDSLAQAVQQGLLTQAQADALLQRLQNAGTFPGLGAVNVYTTIANAGLEAAAKTLGMTSADLTTALQTKTLLDLANEKKVDVAKLRTAIADAEKAAIDQAVKDGKLAQAQADALKANLKPENIDLNRRGFGFAPRGNFVPGINPSNPPGGFRQPPAGRFGRR
ncbi:MAG: hypothetical protein HY868_07590 [Chloroflexi bacterium]|nr:hypothetical protein [Chloroflexota bacterium]